MTTRTDHVSSVRQDRRLIRPNCPQPAVRARDDRRATGASPNERRPPVNLAIVLDRSGSMSGDKLRVAKAAVEEAIGRLQAGRPVQRRRLRRRRRTS